ncbi:MAG TPA: transporter substrate-binding domain-containing protein [Spirochaetota bacterium]|nr:transporter substrate-binding domain-containing protein [Spirochaetota bacterium]
MKRLLLILLFSIFASRSDTQEITWFHSIGWYPFTMEDTTSGRIYGASNDIMNEIAQNLNTTASFKKVPWMRGLIMLEHGKIDICAGAYSNAERRKKYYFTQAVFRNETRIFVKKNKIFKFQNLADLKGKSLVKTRGSSYGTEFDRFATNNIKIQEVSGGTDRMILMVQMERADCFIGDYLNVMNFIRSNKLDKEIIPLDRAVNYVDVYFMVSKQSAWGKKINRINKAVKLLHDNGTIEQILKKY